MRVEFVEAMMSVADDPRVVFITGDLGYMALEPLQKKLGSRFINAGVAEQNMVSVAAGMAHQGLLPFVYSIAPFVTMRPFEQIRNDICLHRANVKLIGNGGGYGYGIMGATHHALQDIGAMRLMPNMTVHVPVFGTDVGSAVRHMLHEPGAAYLRLNLAIKSATAPPPYAAWRQLAKGSELVAITTGPVVSGLLDLVRDHYPGRVSVWSVATFPFGEVPESLLREISAARRVLTLEEHYSAGGLGEAIALQLLKQLNHSVVFRQIAANGYPGDTYGSQTWHQIQNGMSGEPLAQTLGELLSDGNLAQFKRVD